MTARQVSEKSIAIVGRACRLPGARNVAAFWRLLVEGRCAVSEIPADRWLKERFLHPVAGTPGCSYTFAAGVLDDLWSFDAAAFRLSPREAVQMDPQQRILLELVVEALDDAAIPVASLAGRNVGVFVGASALDHGTINLFDPLIGDQYFATGNAQSLLSNRLSHCFDFRGPSFTVDTACSSSLVALNEAVMAIQQGKIDTAIVAGVNALLSPFSFVSFSQAKMLSPTGLCRAFDAAADGYVRAEGAVVLVLRASEQARREENPLRAVIRASGVNSDGRTVGISLPSAASQAALLRDVYASADLDPARLVFLEAHGTGTPAGDPIETSAIGDALASHRRKPLAIGSAKTNIGHTEPVSGLVGVLKASLALEMGAIPPSLHFSKPNPNIPFADLGLRVIDQGDMFTCADHDLAGVSSFGFGGTNAHVVLSAPARADARSSPRRRAGPPGEGRLLMFGAFTPEALPAMAEALAGQIEADTGRIRSVLTATAHRHHRMPARAAVEGSSPHELSARLRAFGIGADTGEVLQGWVDRKPARVAFVYSGNGSQWAGMGRVAFESSAAFRDSFLEVDDAFARLAGWSLRETLHADDLAARLASTGIAQPLLFAVQIAATAALRRNGLAPDIVFGHSVGEIAAADAGGHIDRATALRIVLARSRHQEKVRGLGRMGVFFGDEADCRRLADTAGVEIAAINAPRSFTLAGPAACLDRLAERAASEGCKFHPLELDYPFHSRSLDGIRAALGADLAGLKSAIGNVPMMSTVTGGLIDGDRLGAGYWWRNIREPVRFSDAVRAAYAAGARHFIEVGPKPTLLRHIGDTLSAEDEPASQSHVLDVDQKGDPFLRAVAAAWVAGTGLKVDALFGADPGHQVSLPSYPWQRKTCRVATTRDNTSGFQPGPWHALLGVETVSGSGEWRCRVDARKVPQIAEHRVHGTVVMPGAAFVDMMWAAAAAGGRAHVGEIDIVAPLMFEEGVARDLRTTLCARTGVIEIASRPCNADAPFSLNARGKACSAPDSVPDPVPPAPGQPLAAGAELYALAGRSGLQFGASFRRLKSVWTDGRARIVADLDCGGETSPAFGLEPWRLDAAFHGLIALFGTAGVSRKSPYVPVRFRDARLFRSGGKPATSIIDIVQFDERAIEASFDLLDKEGAVVARLSGVRFQALSGEREAAGIGLYRETWVPLAVAPPDPVPAGIVIDDSAPLGTGADDPDNDRLAQLLEGWALAWLARHGAALLTGKSGDADGSSWHCNLRLALEDFGLADARTGKILPDEIAKIPAPERVVEELARSVPGAAQELLLVSHFTVASDPTSDIREADLRTDRRKLADAVARYGTQATGSAQLALSLLRRMIERGFLKAPARILLIAHGAGTAPVARVCDEAALRLAVYDPDPVHLERARFAAGPTRVDLIDRIEHIDGAGFDVVVSIDALHRLGQPRQAMDILARSLRSGGQVVCVDSSPRLFLDLTCGLAPDWFAEVADLPIGPLMDAAGWKDIARDAGFTHVRSAPIGRSGERRVLMSARAPERRVPVGDPGIVGIEVVDLHKDVGILSRQLAEMCAKRGIDVSSGSTDPKSRASPRQLVLVDSATGDLNAGRLLVLRDALRSAGNRPIWHILAADERDPHAAGLCAALAAMLRTATNEWKDLTVRCVRLPAVPDENDLGQLAALIASGSEENDVLLASGKVCGLRYIPDQPRASAIESAVVRLEKRSGRGLARLRWMTAEHAAPGPDEVEIEVAATGLNFRDVMWTLGLLTDDILDAGFAGPSLGLEVSGIVASVGDKVRDIVSGDRVMAFARHGFATRVVVPSAGVRRVPAGIGLDEAATVPVAFATAWYGLVTLAKLRRGEWVLIHGAAGGVGLAAVQIALARGARVVATAGSAEKRNLLKLCGSDHVFDSRSLDFVDRVRALGEGGVDVVLNSLAGEAMERGIAALRPFGRFIELGKRDFVANTHVGLGKFRSNLSYHAVDLDQLAKARPGTLKRVFGSLEPLFRERVLRPLPCRFFEARDVEDAFRTMQHAEHVGKIVVRRPDANLVPATPDREFIANAERTHLVTGGASGFGLATVRWLVERGARHLVVTGRRAKPSGQAASLFAELAAAGVDIRYRSYDVADAGEVGSLFSELARTMPPLGGLIHSAMVLEDQTLASLTRDGADAVLAPKVRGAANLDVLTRNLALDYFVLYSSATTMIGNPGQSAYVAANAYMEGLVRSRRATGLPALAVALGALTETGALAERPQLLELLERNGVRPFSPTRALDRLSGLIAAAQDGALADPVVYVASLDWGLLRRRLRLLDGPAFGAFAGTEAGADRQSEGRLDLAAILAADGVEAATLAARQALSEIAASILRVPAAAVDAGRRLADVGFDSLMGTELAAAIEARFGLNVEAVGLASDLTLAKLASRLVRHAMAPTEEKKVDEARPAVDVLLRKHAVTSSEAEAALGAIAHHAAERILEPAGK